MTLQLGKLPPTPDDRDLQLVNYLAPVALKQAPVGYGHQALVQAPFGMLGNDRWGDCAIAGPMHATMVWNAAAGKQISFTDAQAIVTYSAITGFNPDVGPPGQNPTDRGTSIRDALRYRQQTGLIDANGATHKIGAYLAIPPGDIKSLLRALYLFEAVEIGFQVPRSAMSQYLNGKPWTVVPGSPIQGGHDVPVVARPNAEGLTAITWGTLQRLSFGFYTTYNDEAWAVVSPEILNGQGKSLEGFDLASLNTDLNALR